MDKNEVHELIAAWVRDNGTQDDRYAVATRCNSFEEVIEIIEDIATRVGIYSGKGIAKDIIERYGISWAEVTGRVLFSWGTFTDL